MVNDYEDLLMNKLMTVKRLSVQEAMEQLGVSKSTVRRIFIALEQRGLVVRSYGGVQLASANVYSFDALSRKFSNEKSRIGKAACKLVNKEDVLFIDAGTTSMNFAFQLSQAIANGTLRVKSIFTNSLATLDVLAPVTAVNLIGGEYRIHRKDCYGYLAERSIGFLNFTKCFLGTDGVINNTSFAAMDMNTAALNASLINHSLQRIVLCDHSKFATTSLVAWAEFDNIDTIVTDSGIDSELKEILNNKGCKLVLV